MNTASTFRLGWRVAHTITEETGVVCGYTWDGKVMVTFDDDQPAKPQPIIPDLLKRVAQ